jgi:hypothetical protein
MNTAQARQTSATRVLSQAIGALAVGAVAIGAIALGAVAVERLAIGRARVRKLEIDELVVRRLRVTEKLQAPLTPDRHNPTVLTSGQAPLERRPEIRRDLPISDARILNLATMGLYAER